MGLSRLAWRKFESVIFVSLQHTAWGAFISIGAGKRGQIQFELWRKFDLVGPG